MCVDDGNRPVVEVLLSGRELIVNRGGAVRRVGRGPARRVPELSHPHAAEEPGHFIQRSLSGRQPDSLDGPRAQGLQPLERQRQVGASLGRHERVDLVHDDALDRAEDLTRTGRQQEVERFGRRDEDVGRVAPEARALGGRGVTCPHRHGRDDERVAARTGGLRDALDRRPEIAIDIHGERLERGHVEHAAPPRGRPRRREHDAVDRPEKRGQRLAAPGRGEDERGLAPCNRGPAERLGRSRGAERRAEPTANGRVKDVEALQMCPTE